MSEEHVEGTFQVTGFEPVEIAVAQPVQTAMSTGVAVLLKTYAGQVDGRSVTLFTGSRDEESGAGSYVAFESFEGTLGSRSGAFSFSHTASTRGTDRYAETFLIIDGSGTDELRGISGSGGLRIDDDGTHRIWFDFALAEQPSG